MKEEYKIFVEGIADKRFLEQLIESQFGSVKKENVICTNGYTKLLSPKTENTYLNIMQRTLDDGGKNLVIFDADDDYERRKKEILDWKQNKGINFELFLLPDNQNPGELEDLLETIINPDNKSVMECWKNYESEIENINLPWKDGKPLTIPAKKTKIYAYLEVLLGTSKSEKDKIKEINREYINPNHWNLNDTKLQNGLVDFLKQNLG